MKHYVIIGASSGIGWQLAKNLSEHHHITALSRNPLPERLQNTTHHVCDISLEQPDFPVIDKPVDGLIYCPGSINLKPFRSFKIDDFTNDLNINLFGAIKSIKHFLPQLQQAENSSVVLFSTVAVQTGMSFHASIAAAKGAVEGLTRSLAAEFAPKIRVNAVAPSLTHTPLADKLLNAEAKLKAAEERHPLKKIGSPDDMAKAVQYLLDANWVTGEILAVNGGMSSIR